MLMIKRHSDIYDKSPKTQAIEIKDFNRIELGPESRTKKMLKTKDEPTICMKTKRRATKRPLVHIAFFDEDAWAWRDHPGEDERNAKTSGMVPNPLPSSSNRPKIRLHRMMGHFQQGVISPGHLPANAAKPQEEE